MTLKKKKDLRLKCHKVMLFLQWGEIRKALVSLKLKTAKNKRKILNLRERKSNQHKMEPQKWITLDTRQWSYIFNIYYNLDPSQSFSNIQGWFNIRISVSIVYSFNELKEKYHMTMEFKSAKNVFFKIQHWSTTL